MRECFMKKSIFNVFVVFILCLFFSVGCGRKSVDIASLKKNDSEVLVNKKAIRIKNQTINRVLSRVLPYTLNISPECCIEQNGKIIFPPRPGESPTKEAMNVIQKQISFKLPANSTLGDLADILNEQLGKKGEFIDNVYLIRL